MNRVLNALLESHELGKSNLLDAPVYGPDNNQVGQVTGFQGDEPALEVILEVGGFLGLGAKSAVVPLPEITFMRDDSGSIHGVTNWTKEQMKAAPEPFPEDTLFPVPPVL